MAREQLDRAGVAERTGLAIKSVDTYRQRGVLPEPDGHVGRSPWWYSTTIDRWDAKRRKLGAGQVDA